LDQAAAKATLERLFRAGVAAALPSAVVPEAVRGLAESPTILLAAGKGAAEMAEAALAAGVTPLAGLVVTRFGQGRPSPGLEVIQAAHPIPDASSLAAARRMLVLAGDATADDRILMLLSGGASALLCLPGVGLTLDAKQAVTRALLRSGAPVEAINTVRRHLSGIKGGRLAAAAYPARLTTLAISDVVGDAPEAIGSGPTAPDPTTLAEAKAILDRHGVADPGAGWSESLKRDDRRFIGARYRVIASARMSLNAIRSAAAAEGYQPISLGDDLEGEARHLGARHAQAARDYAGRDGRFALISGGETTVTLRGGGKGGPNFEYAAALALGIEGLTSVCALSGDSDGIDGNADASGAFVDGDSAGRARESGLSLDRALAANDTASAFAALGDVFAPGHTGTNVNDFRLILISPRQA
jgi:glycerate 2-kinase